MIHTFPPAESEEAEPPEELLALFDDLPEPDSEPDSDPLPLPEPLPLELFDDFAVISEPDSDPSEPFDDLALFDDLTDLWREW